MRTSSVMSKFGKQKVNFMSSGFCMYTLINASHLRDTQNRISLFSARPFPCRCIYASRLSLNNYQRQASTLQFKR